MNLNAQDYWKYVRLSPDSVVEMSHRLYKFETMNPHELTLAGFQKHIFDKYEKVDRERGTPKTFLWFIEEVGELATALNGEDRQNLEEEFADVIAWLCTLANINDIDLAGAVAKKYLSEKPPQGHK